MYALCVPPPAMRSCQISLEWSNEGSIQQSSLPTCRSSLSYRHLSCLWLFLLWELSAQGLVAVSTKEVLTAASRVELEALLDLLPNLIPCYFCCSLHLDMWRMPNLVLNLKPYLLWLYIKLKAVLHWCPKTLSHKSLQWLKIDLTLSVMYSLIKVWWPVLSGVPGCRHSCTDPQGAASVVACLCHHPHQPLELCGCQHTAM